MALACQPAASFPARHRTRMHDKKTARVALFDPPGPLLAPSRKGFVSHSDEGPVVLRRRRACGRLGAAADKDHPPELIGAFSVRSGPPSWLLRMVRRIQNARPGDGVTPISEVTSAALSD
jgi:hypothetical protein